MGDVRLRPVTRDDVAYLVAKQTPEVSAPYNWFGFRSEAEYARHLEEDGFLGDLYGKLIAEVATADGPVPIGVENTAERRALERAGFTFEGILRRAQFRGGAWRDMALYSRLRGE